MYKRKTKDEYQLHVKYDDSYGFEHEISEDSRREILARLREYRENCPQYPTKIVVKRVPLNRG